MIKVAINGYGTIGKRVLMRWPLSRTWKLSGVSKTDPQGEAYIANERGYPPLYIADITKKPAFDEAGIAVAGDVEGMLRQCDIVVDATPPGGVGKSNKALYELYNVKAIWQGGEKHELAGISFNSSCNYHDAFGADFVRVVSCNTTGLCRIIQLADEAYGVKSVFATMVRRGSDPPGGIKKGPVDAIVLNPVTIPSHHGPDVNTILPSVDIVTTAMIVPTTFMHMHVIRMELAREASCEGVLDLIRKHPRIGIVKGASGITSTAELRELASDMGRPPRGDLWESCVYEDSVAVGKNNELYLFQAIHQEADVVVENIDAIRAMMKGADTAEESVRITNEALGLKAI
ncbi:type II glyceraldehyde-3-phosphate dehydrogenase [Methanogenium cariaci]|uniref:type II glyceraldehyde-3-phosphate dehydrogenase n=1 Tax=Methanogenium cariaci TaxID=2197 RepID=UPI0007867652|nr:type II glyceraldehyde-3-phosphate dehydrogenase [Methanogenium cariaci]